MHAVDFVNALVAELEKQVRDIEHKAVRGADYEKVLKFQGEVRGLEAAIAAAKELAQRALDE